MIRAQNATVEWDEQKKRWEVHIQVGAEVIKRPVPKSVQNTDDFQILKAQAVEISKDEGYDLTPEQVDVVQRK
jgi:hypothetical protein